jgi:hypothetical protein
MMRRRFFCWLNMRYSLQSSRTSIQNGTKRRAEQDCGSSDGGGDTSLPPRFGRVSRASRPDVARLASRQRLGGPILPVARDGPQRAACSSDPGTSECARPPESTPGRAPGFRTLGQRAPIHDILRGRIDEDEVDRLHRAVASKAHCPAVGRGGEWCDRLEDMSAWLGRDPVFLTRFERVGWRIRANIGSRRRDPPYLSPSSVQLDARSRPRGAHHHHLSVRNVIAIDVERKTLLVQDDSAGERRPIGIVATDVELRSGCCGKCALALRL